MYHKLNFTVTNFTSCSGTCTVHKRPKLLLFVSVWLFYFIVANYQIQQLG